MKNRTPAAKAGFGYAIYGTVENRISPIPFDLSLVFITLGEPQAHGDTAEAVPFHD